MRFTVWYARQRSSIGRSRRCTTVREGSCVPTFWVTTGQVIGEFSAISTEEKRKADRCRLAARVSGVVWR
jgi:hypothetical protein